MSDGKSRTTGFAHKQEPTPPGARDLLLADSEFELQTEGADKFVSYTCPRDPSRSCGVPLHPNSNPNGATWQWDGHREMPTLTPSINCSGPVGCGWHGWMRNGRLVDA